MAELSDLSLVAQVTVFHNKRAFDQLVRKYQSPVRRFLLNLTAGNEALSDDLAQDTFLKAYTNIRQFRGLASFQTWLMRIAYNTFYDYQRRGERKESGVEHQETLEAAQHSFVARHSTLDEKLDIHTALAILKEEERTCITLQLIDGYPIDEIAEITRMPANTVKSHLKRGKEKLTNYLKQNGYDR